MSVNVVVTGLPGDTKFSRLVFSFKGILKRIQIKKFWIQELTDMYGSDCKQMTVEFANSAEARKARNYLNNLPYTQGKAEHRLMAMLEEESYPTEYHEEREWVSNRRPAKRGRPVSRSPSPGYRREASKLDMEIELLRKQRQVIEEERRLLLEQKKLDLIKEYGPSAARDFDDYEPPRKRRYSSEVESKVPPRKRSPPPSKGSGPPNAPKGLPAFFHPCKKLIAEMRPFIDRDTTAEEKDILVKLLRAAIRKSLAVALDGKDYMPTAKILNLYRELHPKSTDAAFVDKILANIRASYLPDELEGNVSKATGIKTQPENTASDKDLQVVVKSENDAKSIPKVKEILEGKPAANEENGTGEGEVKTEPNPDVPEHENAESTANDAFISESAEGAPGNDEPEKDVSDVNTNLPEVETEKPTVAAADATVVSESVETPATEKGDDATEQ